MIIFWIRPFLRQNPSWNVSLLDQFLLHFYSTFWYWMISLCDLFQHQWCDTRVSVGCVLTSRSAPRAPRPARGPVPSRRVCAPPTAGRALVHAHTHTHNTHYATVRAPLSSAPRCSANCQTDCLGHHDNPSIFKCARTCQDWDGSVNFQRQRKLNFATVVLLQKASVMVVAPGDFLLKLNSRKANMR